MKSEERYYYRKSDWSNCFIYPSKLKHTSLIEITKAEYDEFVAKQNQPLPHYEPSAEEKRVRGIRRQIANLKSQLAKTDYQAIKHSEGWISEEDYAPIKAARQELRDQINELESQL